ncbi:DNA replication and repair protein RecF [Patescibacteria group bacterium]|nr:DNA replication and repair protein RecF [Patescibacteria group bacterium]MBU1931513.1 DNA replication and repair protein RecF [Patescibacteria group bacterium]
MKLKQLSLVNFRSFSNKSFKFSPAITLIVGDNGAGKTNLLEALFLLSTGRSFRATKEAQMINNGAELARIQTQTETDSLEIVLTTGEIAGQKVAKKRYLLNGVAKRRMDFISCLRCVLFRPEDINLILGSPSLRRDYLDTVLESVDWQYRRSNLAYQKGLRQRNKLLQRIREGEAQRSQLLFWNRLLIKNGELISQKRQELIDFINHQLETDQRNTRLEYDKSAISPERLEKYKEAEVGAGATLIGPHRDDVKFLKSNQRDLALYGSRGEQRMAVLATKLSELVFITQRIQEKPLLLLDDIFSELDENNRQLVWQLINQHQTIITATDEDLVSQQTFDKIIKIGK